MRVYTHSSELSLPWSQEEVFAFFADVANLGLITPPWLHFRMVTSQPVTLRPGALIDYRLRVHGIPLRWRTEIKVWEPPCRFVDRQLRGPYRLWEHEHTFEEVDGGTLCRDHVRYAVPGGELVYRLLVRREVERIFAHRREVLKQRFS